MTLTDLTLPELRAYRPDADEPADFDAFWVETIADARSFHGDTIVRPVSTGITQLAVEDLEFAGFNGEPIRAWVARPLRARGPLPTVLEFVGYGLGRGTPGEHVRWALAGYVHIVMDTRGQGSGWGTGGTTGDPYGSGPAVPGYMTRGIHDPRDYYYRRLYTDAVRAVDAARSLPFVDKTRIAVTGHSQGGAVAIAVSALTEVLAVMPDAAFLGAIRRGAELAQTGPFQEITAYLSTRRDEVHQVFTTLSYFDIVNFARRIHVPALFSVALMDRAVPPSTTFGAYNSLAAEDRSIEVYPFNGHEAGESTHWMKQIDWLASRI